MAIELPRVLKNMNLFVDGRGYAGRVDEIQLPKLTLKTEEHRAGGMDIPVEIELGMEKLEAQLTISDYDPEVFKLFGLLDFSESQITLRGAIQAQGSEAKPVIVHLRGGWKELESSNWKPGSARGCCNARRAGYGPPPMANNSTNGPCGCWPMPKRPRPCSASRARKPAGGCAWKYQPASPG